jgi:hypothetical protein
MAYTPKGDRNFMAAMKRMTDRLWFGADVSARAQLPLALSGEPIISGNNALNGTVGLIGSDVNDQVAFPLQAGITITAAQINALNTSPVTIVPAPGAGLALVLEGIIIEINRTATAFTGGGAVGPVYQGATGTFLTANQVAASDVTTGGAGQVNRFLTPASTAGGLAIPANTAIQLYAGTANFAAGTGTIKAFVTYSVVTL